MKIWTRALLADHRFILLVSLIVRMILLNNARGILHPDEQYQGIEMAFYLLNPDIVFKIIPWEFSNAMRSYLWVYMMLPFVWLALNLGIRGVGIFIFFRALLSLFNLASIWYFLRFLKREIDPLFEEIKPSVFIGWFLSTYAPLLILISFITPDSFGISMLFFLTPMIIHELKQQNSWKQQLLLGILIGITISLRFQSALFFVPIGLLVIYQRKLGIIAGFLLGILPLAVLDLIYYNVPMVTAYNFFIYNFYTQTNAEKFYLFPWWMYIGLFFGFHLVFGAFLILYSHFRSRQRIKQTKLDQAILYGVYLYLITFQILTYKEIKFILPAIIIFSALSLLGLPDLIGKYKNKKPGKYLKIALICYFLITSLALFIIPVGYRQNMLIAQEYVYDLDPEASVFVMHNWGYIGGRLIQNPDHLDADFYYMNRSFNKSTEEILSLVDYVIIDRNSASYLEHFQMMNSSCSSLGLLVVMDDNYINPLVYYLIDLAGEPNNDVAEVWACNLFPKSQ